jgi:hypothetical protein
MTACSGSSSHSGATSSTEPAGLTVSFSEHPISPEEAAALRNTPPAERAGNANFAALVAQTGRVLDLGVVVGVCSGQTAKTQSVVRDAADRVVVTVRATPPPPQAQTECGKTGTSLGLSVTLPSDERFTGIIDVRETT